MSTPSGGRSCRLWEKPHLAVGIFPGRKQVHLSCLKPMPDQSDNVEMQLPLVPEGTAMRHGVGPRCVGLLD